MKKETGYPSIDRAHEKDYNFFDRHPIIPDISIYNAIKLLNFFNSNGMAVDCINLTASYKEMGKDAITISKAFKELGIKADDIITVNMPNLYQAIVIFLAANRIGAVTTFLNSQSGIDEVKNYLNLFESPLFINYNKSIEYNESVKKDTKVRQIITLSKEDINNKNINKIIELPNKKIGYNDFLLFREIGTVSQYYNKMFRTWFDGKQNSLILFTSGSTGSPKSVVLTNENIISSGIYMKNTAKVNFVQGESCFICVPFAYPYGFATSTITSFLCGRKVILAPNLSKDNISYYLEKNPNFIFGSPALLELMKRNIPLDLDLSSVHTFISGGDFLTTAQNERGVKFFREHNSNTVICNGSGNAESCGASTIAVGSNIRPETVGKVLIGTGAIIVNPDTMKELKYGEEGMLCISGKHIFDGYFKEQAKTEESKFLHKDKEYLKTGTIGILDKQGYFTLTGRSSRFYIRSDLNKVYLEHVQNVISSIEIVESCVVVPKNDNSLLYVNKAYIVLKAGILPTKEIYDYIMKKCCEQIRNVQTGEILQLKDFEIPESIEFLDEIPRNRADKIDYSLLESLANNEHKKIKKL